MSVFTYQSRKSVISTKEKVLIFRLENKFKLAGNWVSVLDFFFLSKRFSWLNFLLKLSNSYYLLICLSFAPKITVKS